MPKKKAPEEKPADQFKRFVETAREHRVDDDVKALDRVFEKLAKQTQKRRAKK